MGYEDGFVRCLLGTELCPRCSDSALLSRPRPGRWDTAEGPARSRPGGPAGEARGAPEPAAQEGAEGQREPWCQAKRDAEGAQSTACAGETPQGIYAGPVPEVCSLLLRLPSAETAAPPRGLFAW